MPNDNQKKTEQKITDTLVQNYMPYAMSVIVSRAIPEIDGFKPAHRKILYSMYDMGLMNKGPVKCANIVGAGMRLNPHGDSSIYETMVRMADSNETLLFPFIKAKGSFGKHYSRDMSPAAYRYTEAMLTKSCEAIFRDINKNAVDFVDNYDGTMKEPTLLPVLFPSILVNSNQGIAVGMASNICSFNLKEICDTTIGLIKNKNFDIYSTLLGPDFTTGGELLYNRKNIENIYETGRGSFDVRAVWKYDAKHRIIEITEIPFSTTSEVIIEKIIDLVKQGKIKDIDNVRDETGLNGLKIAIDLKRGADPESIMKKLFKYTTLQDSFPCNFNILIAGTPKVLGIKGILNEWVDFRCGCIRRSLKYDLVKNEKRLHLFEGIETVLLDIDKVIKIIRSAQNDNEVIALLMKKIKVDEEQANYIADIKLRNLNKDYLIKLIKDKESLIKEIAKIKDTLASDKKVKNVICQELKDISKKYSQDRKTKIVTEYENVDSSEKGESVEEDPFSIILTAENYVKKIYGGKKDDVQKLKENDKIIENVNNIKSGEILLFNSGGNVYKKQFSDIKDCKANQLGEYLPAIIGCPTNEKSIFGCILEDDKFVVIVFENGKVAKIPMTAYKTATNRKKLVNAYYSGIPVKNILKCSDSDTLIVSFDSGKPKNIAVSKISSKITKNTQGVQAINLKNQKILNVSVKGEIKCHI